MSLPEESESRQLTINDFSAINPELGQILQLDEEFVELAVAYAVAKDPERSRIRRDARLVLGWMTDRRYQQVPHSELRQELAAAATWAADPMDASRRALEAPPYGRHPVSSA